MNLITEIANAVKNLAWVYGPDGTRQPQLEGFPDKVDWSLLKNWPMSKELGKLLDLEENKEKEKICNHIRGVVASINELICNNFRLTPSGNKNYDDSVSEELRKAHRFCLRLREKDNPDTVLQSEGGLLFAQNFLRVAALYHDIGKIIGNDRHVSRGVHLMRDVNNTDREAFEQGLMGGCFEDKHNFWTLLSHHDIFGCLCTGEASLPALSQMVSWSGDHSIIEPYKSPAALVSYLMLLNVADGDSSLSFGSKLNGLRTVEAKRYLADWNTVKNLLWDKDILRPKEVSREVFKEGLLRSAGHPEGTIERITRMITSSYRMQMSSDLLLDESEVRKLVEDELDMLHGARLQMFCYLFARFCKIDYGLRFINVIMLFELLNEDHGLLMRKDEIPLYEYPDNTCPIGNLSDNDR
ncbi:MAG TPA: hypothetical protein VMW42_03180, partial [Desulfatiglandales bacterium]|nr:hypothetical protein [Desulfatiglandales bacterium]